MKCEKCKSDIADEYIICHECGDILVDGYSRCDRCHHIIAVLDAKFCPHCQYQLIEVPVERGEIKIEDRAYEVGRSELLSHIRFNFNETDKITSSIDFTRKAMTYKLITGLTAGFNFTILLLLFATGASGTVQDAIRAVVLIMVIQPAILFGLSFIIKNTMGNLDVELSYKNSINLIGAYTPIFFIKDILIIPSLLYIFIFTDDKDRGYSLGLVIYGTLTAIVFVYMLVHLAIYIHNTVKTNYFMSVVIMLFNYSLTALIFGWYIGFTLYLIIDMII